MRRYEDPCGARRGVGTASRRNLLPCFVTATLILLVPAGFSLRSARAAEPKQPEDAARESAGPSGEGGGTTRARMRNVDFRYGPQIVLEIRELHGELLPSREGEPPFFDQPDSLIIGIESAEVAADPATLAALMNEYVLAYEGAPIGEVEVELRENRIVLSATLQRAVPVPVTIEGELSPTAGGDIRVHPTSIEAAKLPVKGVMELFGVEVVDLINTHGHRGLSIVENDLVLDPERALPPPRVRGRVSAVRIEGNRVVQIFGDPSQPAELSPPLDVPNYMLFVGGVLRFGKLTMQDADLQIADTDPDDPFDFFLAGYQKQLVAGYSRTLADQGLVAFMPDFSDAEEGAVADPEP